MSEQSTLKQVRALIDPIVTDLHLDLYDLEFRSGTLRITIDTPPGSPGGVDLDVIALATRLISREFDHHDPVPGHYTLEVTSPGLERTLRTPAHFQREVGKTVALRLRDTGADDRRVQGVLIAADEQAATVRLDSCDTELVERVVRYDVIDRARTVFQWGPAPKPGSKPAAKPKGPAKTAPAKNRPSSATKAGTTKSGTTKSGTTKSGASKPAASKSGTSKISAPKITASKKGDVR